MVWYGMVWYGMAWCGMVWCGMVWYGVQSALSSARHFLAYTHLPKINFGTRSAGYFHTYFADNLAGGVLNAFFLCRERLLRRSSSVSRSRVSVAGSSPMPSLAEQEAVAGGDRLLLELGHRVAAAASAAAEINRSTTTTNDTASLASHSVSIDLSSAADNAAHNAVGGGGSDSLSLDSHRVYRRGGGSSNSHNNGLNDPLCVSTPKSSASRSIRRHQHQHPPLRQRGSRERPASSPSEQERKGATERRAVPEKKEPRRKSLDMRSGSSDLSESEKRGTLTSLSSNSTSTASPPSTCSTASPPSSTASPPSR